MIQKPDQFLTIRLHLKEVVPELCGLCVGYERGTWRAAQLADHLFEWLPEFALRFSEWEGLQHANAVSMLRRAASIVYQTKKFGKRGEFGELMLHAVIRQVFDSIPAVSKIYYKSAANDTVKGFDAVHVVGPPDRMELWLGEVKFYSSIRLAISHVVKEIDEHLDIDYLRSEFTLIANKIDVSATHAQALRRLLSPNTSLDQVFARASVPVLLTYDSGCVATHDQCGEEYVAAFVSELKDHLEIFQKKMSKMKNRPPEVAIRLFLVPLSDKKAFVKTLDDKLRVWQKL